MNANLDIEMDCVYRVFILAQFERVALRVYVICMLRSFRTRVALGPLTILGSSQTGTSDDRELTMVAPGKSRGLRSQRLARNTRISPRNPSIHWLTL